MNDKQNKIHSSATMPILTGMIMLGELKDVKLETLEEEPGSGMREHDCLTLTFPSGRVLKIDTVCSGTLENTGIVIDNVAPPSPDFMADQGTASIVDVVTANVPSGLSPNTHTYIDPQWMMGKSAGEIKSVKLLMEVQHQLEMGNFANDEVFAFQIEEHLKWLGARK